MRRKLSGMHFLIKMIYGLEDKLAIAIQRLKERREYVAKPCLYYGKPRVVNQNMDVIATRLWDDARNNYSSALIENKCTGCTMVFNYELMKLICQKNSDFIVMHDEWIHKSCLVAGGITYWDDDVHMLYRRHGGNVTDVDKITVFHRIYAHIRSFQKKACPRSKIVVSLYDCYKEQMTQKNLQLTELVVNYKKIYELD